jgi:hypothetical protein
LSINALEYPSTNDLAYKVVPAWSRYVVPAREGYSDRLISSILLIYPVAASVFATGVALGEMETCCVAIMAANQVQCVDEDFLAAMILSRPLILYQRENLWRRLFDYISSPAEVRKGQSMRAMRMVQCTRVRGAKMGDLSEKAEGHKMVETVSG